MARKVCLVSYHEIALKGKNRRRFEEALLKNLRAALSGFPLSRLERFQGRILCVPKDEAQVEGIAEAAAKVPGVARVAIAWRGGRSEEAFAEAAILAMRESEPFRTFKVHAKKSNTDYAEHTLDINRSVGAALCAAFPEKVVQMHHPDVTITVNVVGGESYVYGEGMRGAGGLPVGTAGKVVSLLSSGFDSPVASWMVGRRGACVCPVHFSGRPVTSDASEWLVQDILEALRPYGMVGRLYVVPFGEIQRRMALEGPPELRVILYRRAMVAIAERVAEIEGAKALVTGESLGQVASQTLDNIRATNDAVRSLPVLRPLIGSDKVEIIERAREIGTFELSSEKAPDCCTLFMPRRPETHARLEVVRRAWDALDPDALIDEGLSLLEYVDIEGCPGYKAPRALPTRHDALASAGWTPRGDGDREGSAR